MFLTYTVNRVYWNNPQDTGEREGERERSEMKERREGKRDRVNMCEMREQDLTLPLTE